MFGLILGLIAMSALDTVRKVDALATANSDNVQWTLSQVEVELVRLEFAILSAHDGLATLGDVRRRFDVFYNRVDIITNGSVYAGVLDATDAREAKKDLWLILESSVALIDGPDDVLRGALPDLADAFRDLRPAVREIALEGVRALAERSDQQREAVAGTLVRLAFLTTALFFLLGLGLFVLAQMNRQVQRRQMEYQVTAARLNAIVATSQDAVVVADVEGRLLDFNGAVEKIFGYQAAEVLGRSMSDVIVPHHMRDAHEAGMDRYRRTGRARSSGAAASSWKRGAARARSFRSRCRSAAPKAKRARSSWPSSATSRPARPPRPSC
ncbi:MAG: PAS domain S-box protein [Paracoccaceae bacterium]